MTKSVAPMFNAALERLRREVEARTRNLVQRMWSHAWVHFIRAIDGLHQVEMTSWNVWKRAWET